MKIIITFILLMIHSLSFAWELEKTIESEGVQTNLIKCDNGKIKAVYFETDGYYRITPVESFNTLDEAAVYICNE